MRRATFGSISSCCIPAEAGGASQRLELGAAHPPPSARWQPLECERPDARPHKPHHPPARARHHASDLAIPPLDQLDLILGAPASGGERPHANRSQQLALRLDTRDEPCEPWARQRPVGPHPVHLGHMVPRMDQPRRQLTVVCEKQKPLAVPVEPAHGIQPHANRARQKIENRSAPLWIAAGAQDSAGLVQEEILPGLRPQAAPVDADVILGGIHPRAGLKNRPAVDRHPPGTNPFDGAAPRCDATFRKKSLKPNVRRSAWSWAVRGHGRPASTCPPA